jgi:hypothetical protein
MEAGRKINCAVLLAASALGLFTAGCGMPGAPQPPSLNLPQPVKDLRAVRTGNEVSLVWSMPRRNTDQMLLKETLVVRICRAETNSTTCVPAGQVSLLPTATGVFTEQLPAQLTVGLPRALSYWIEVENARGKSAGPPNVVHIVAGQAPAPVASLKAEVRKSGVVLRWTPIAGDRTPVRLVRRLLTPQPGTQKQSDPLAPAPEPATQDLLITAHAAEGRALDHTTRFNETYEYRAQRVARVTVDGETVELSGALSEPVRVDVRNLFPPEPPQGLAAVAAAPGSGPAIDLNWQPNTEADLAGYIVYRREGDAAWQRVSSDKLLTAPAFHDATALPGHSYRYAVSAVDQDGHESPRSGETEEAVPAE